MDSQTSRGSKGRRPQTTVLRASGAEGNHLTPRAGATSTFSKDEDSNWNNDEWSSKEWDSKTPESQHLLNGGILSPRRGKSRSNRGRLIIAFAIALLFAFVLTSSFPSSANRGGKDNERYISASRVKSTTSQAAKLTAQAVTRDSQKEALQQLHIHSDYEGDDDQNPQGIINLVDYEGQDVDDDSTPETATITKGKPDEPHDWEGENVTASRSEEVEGDGSFEEHQADYDADDAAVVEAVYNDADDEEGLDYEEALLGEGDEILKSPEDDDDEEEEITQKVVSKSKTTIGNKKAGKVEELDDYGEPFGDDYTHLGVKGDTQDEYDEEALQDDEEDYDAYNYDQQEEGKDGSSSSRSKSNPFSEEAELEEQEKRAERVRAAADRQAILADARAGGFGARPKEGSSGSKLPAKEADLDYAADEDVDADAEEPIQKVKASSSSSTTASTEKKAATTINKKVVVVEDDEEDNIDEDDGIDVEDVVEEEEEEDDVAAELEDEVEEEAKAKSEDYEEHLDAVDADYAGHDYGDFEDLADDDDAKANNEDEEAYDEQAYDEDDDVEYDEALVDDEVDDSKSLPEKSSKETVTKATALEEYDEELAEDDNIDVEYDEALVDDEDYEPMSGSKTTKKSSSGARNRRLMKSELSVSRRRL